MSDATTSGTVAAHEFLVPDLGEGLESVTIVEWSVAVGQPVGLNQPLCTVETAKAEVDVPSPYEGTVIELGGREGETLAVGTLLARIESTSSSSAPPASPVDRRAMAEAGPAAPTARQPTLVGYGLDESIDRSRRSRRTKANGVHPVDRPRARAKPPVRKLAQTLGVDLAALAPGSGDGGIVTRADVERAARSTSADGAARSTGPGYSVVPVRGVRAVVAERMAISHASIPTATCGVTVDATDLLAARATINAALERRGSARVVTPFSLLCHLFVQSLVACPLLNSTFVDDAGTPGGAGGSPEIRVFDDVHLGFATATPRGLLVPVVHGAQARGLVDLSTEMARLASAGRDGALAPADLRGSTITVSNFGALGLDDGIPIINPPEAAILGVGSIRKRPHVVDDEVVARSTAALALCFDHRVCDGAEAGALMARLRELIESPVLALAT